MASVFHVITEGRTADGWLGFDPGVAQAANVGIFRLRWSDYAAVTGKTKEDWARVDLSVGNVGPDLAGWVQEVTLNLNGPCDDLPMVEP